MKLNRDYGGSLPACENPGPARTREECIFDCIRLALKNNQTHSEIVQGLIKRIYVLTDKAGWYWLKYYYERELLRFEKEFFEASDELGGKIDQINQRSAK